MSLLVNSSFEQGVLAPWQRLNQPGQTLLGIGNTPGLAMIGVNYATLYTAVAGGSIGQDFSGYMPSVAAIAYVRSGSGAAVNGRLALWDFVDMTNAVSSFVAANAWVSVMTVKDLRGSGSPHAARPANSIRVEIYLDTPKADLFIDSVTAF